MRRGGGHLRRGQHPPGRERGRERRQHVGQPSDLAEGAAFGGHKHDLAVGRRGREMDMGAEGNGCGGDEQESGGRCRRRQERGQGGGDAGGTHLEPPALGGPRGEARRRQCAEPGAAAGEGGGTAWGHQRRAQAATRSGGGAAAHGSRSRRQGGHPACQCVVRCEWGVLQALGRRWVRGLPQGWWQGPAWRAPAGLGAMECSSSACSRCSRGSCAHNRRSGVPRLRHSELGAAWPT